MWFQNQTQPCGSECHEMKKLILTEMLPSLSQLQMALQQVSLSSNQNPLLTHTHTVHVDAHTHTHIHVHVQKIFNPPPQFSRLGTLCPTLVACLFVSWDGGFLGFFLLLSVSLLVCYTHIIPCTCRSLYYIMHVTILFSNSDA